MQFLPMQISSKALLFASILCGASVSSAQDEPPVRNWVAVTASPAGSIYQIDRNQTATGQDDEGPYVIADYLIDESKNASKKQNSTFMRYHIQCETNAFKMVYFAAYDEAGKPMAEGPVPNPLYLKATAGTLSADLIKSRCEN